MPEHEYSIGRRLYATAGLRQDWDDEPEAVSPGYLELFVESLARGGGFCHCGYLQRGPDVTWLVLFFYMLGMAVTIVNASYETAATFSMGIILQRAAWLTMLVPVASQVSRARDFVFTLGLITFASLLPHLVVVCKPDWVVAGWTVAAVIDMLTEDILSFSLPGTKLVPINIEHTKDRLGVLVCRMTRARG